jgi:hypothetical protein
MKEADNARKATQNLHLRTGKPEVMVQNEKVSEADFTETADLLYSNPGARSYHESFCDDAAGTRVFCFISASLGKGTYIGTGTEGMLPHDKVVLLAGVPVPMILREVDSKVSPGVRVHQVIGPIFLPAIRNGEWWPWSSINPPQSGDLEEFILE